MRFGNLLIGFLCADGCIYANNNQIELSLKLDDFEHLEKFKDFVEWKGKVRKDYFRCRVCFGDKTIHHDLIKLGCIPNKSLVLKFPTEDQVPEELIRHFIRGYFDGDGCIYFTKQGKGNCNFSVLGTKEFLEGLMNKININKKLRKDKRHLNNTWSFSMSGIECYKKLKEIYINSTIALDRKAEKFELINKMFKYEN